ncbi:NAD(P)-dependent dehydrogenase, short-chain alcohol dehydrogenase family [Pedobacter westerhofensis]|uniref:NAD(P)-dependent dehydrogenase, short-chain alcohol dehydrogenase family n=1 Tax=Pedobacter westerhofensis TaxID=425512 RepID=A0A521FRH4_9SPHI|nr:SDR family oxidoreductase [Pedobacter westerhofensis]SMO98071.1 NAD(P)-dependent dehydrogenase, short-chain alcohol dehydrogenase family [Pedobacter westerhofensis]
MKNVLVTGANKGIGFEVAKQLAELGYFVFLGCRDLKKGLEAVDSLKELDILNVEALKIDVADLGSVRQAASELTSKIEVLDILINNAGTAGPQPQNISQCDISIVKELFDTNVFGALQTTQAMMPLLKKSSQPVIVNVSSEVGSLTMQTSEGRNPNWDLYHVYGSTKTALNAFTIALANEFKNTKFRINSATPGYTATDLNGFAGFKTAAQGAKPIVKLATFDADGPTGKFFREEGEVPW